MHCAAYPIQYVCFLTVCKLIEMKVAAWLVCDVSNHDLTIFFLERVSDLVAVTYVTFVCFDLIV